MKEDETTALLLRLDEEDELNRVQVEIKFTCGSRSFFPARGGKSVSGISRNVSRERWGDERWSDVLESFRKEE